MLKRNSKILTALLMFAFALSGCGDMVDQPRYEPMEASNFYADGRSARPLVEGTVARGQLHDDVQLYTGKVDGKPADTFPFPIDEKVLLRGQERYNIYCSVCHDRAGYGLGMVVRRGFKRPPSFHEQRLKDASPGYFFGVMTNGFGAMFDYAAQVTPEDRWAIAAYIRVLQASQDVSLNEIPADAKAMLLEQKKATGFSVGTGGYEPKH
ncbi:MAG TPA: cytochrome c [Verrucomicrobiae bacterium]|jgi:mono/diheme cytochrome c family protein|nr:cytochrome c [Verrucomicrobiae bacterium]